MLTLAEFKAKLSHEGLADWPKQTSVESLWCFEMSAAAKDIWPYLSDTSRLNREMGFGAREQIEKDGKLIVTTKMLGLIQKWVEEPWTWIENQIITCERNYLRGFAKHMFSLFFIETDSVSGRRLVYVYFGWQPKNKFWAKFLSLTAPILRNKFAAAFAKIDAALMAPNDRAPRALTAKAEVPSPAALDKVARLRPELVTAGFNGELIDRFTNYLLTADQFDVEPVRILPLARSWNLESRDLLALALQATRVGILKISWDVVCPHCRGSRYSAESLGSIPSAANCEVCDIDFTTSDENSIEVLFHIHPSLRKIEAMAFCAAEPAKKSHIRMQQLARPGQALKLNLKLGDGSYRVRANGQNWQTELDIQTANSEHSLELTPVNTKKQLANTFNIHATDLSTEPTMIVVEETKWHSDSLKPGAVLALPEFRDVFAKEHLNSNVKLFLGTQTILFTDIVGSTSFYAKVGDAKAFAEVRTHFQELFELVRRHRGAVVKTIGDSVMASFTDPEAAIAAAIEIQKCFHTSREDISIRLRISIHSGPVIAVELNTGLDYFGNTVNLAAKIQSCAGACEIALSEAAYKAYVPLALDLPMVKRQNLRDGAPKADVFVIQVAAPLAAKAA